jgi:hypothetical protein
MAVVRTSRNAPRDVRLRTGDCTDDDNSVEEIVR